VRGFQPKDTGAYRTAGTIGSPSTSYGKCEICGGAYQLSMIVRGLGSYSRPHNYREIEARKKAASDIAEKVFRDPKKRCVCDSDEDSAELQESSNAGVRKSKVHSVSSELAVGDFVRHAVFGNGIVEDIKGTGDTAEISVRFDSKGLKKLALAWAPLEKISSKKNDSSTARPASPSNKVPGSGKSIAEELSQLWELFNAGALTSDQFESAKNLLLGKTD
jgi:hypothetical protein